MFKHPDPDPSVLSADARIYIKKLSDPSLLSADAGPTWRGLRFMFLFGMGFASTWEAHTT